jgi:hypothetical protein
MHPRQFADVRQLCKISGQRLCKPLPWENRRIIGPPLRICMLFWKKDRGVANGCCFIGRVWRRERRKPRDGLCERIVSVLSPIDAKRTVPSANKTLINERPQRIETFMLARLRFLIP